MNKPIVSIIIPTYGGPKFLARALNSILFQTLENWEVIVVDDNGRGTKNQLETESIVETYLSDSRIHYIVHEINKNGSAARNTGFASSKGSFIALLDDDDEYLPHFLESQVECINQQDESCGLVYCSYSQYVDDKEVRIVQAEKQGNVLYETFMHSFEIPTSSWLIRREAYESLNGFDESFRRHQDWEFLNRLAAKYQIMANSKVCYKRHIGYRNSPKSSDQFIAYRNHYLSKMQHIILTLPPIQQKRVIISNKLDAIIPLLKERKVRRFLKEYLSIKPGYFGLKFLARRILKRV